MRRAFDEIEPLTGHRSGETAAIFDDPSRVAPFRLRSALRVFQYHPSVAATDAIGNSIRILHGLLRQHGLESVIVCADDQLARSSGGPIPLSAIVKIAWRPSDVLVVHYSFFDVSLGQVLSLPVRKILVYHNITPGHFFRDVGMEDLANECDLAREQLAGIRGEFAAAVGDSSFNCQDLVAMNFTAPEVIPVLFDQAFGKPVLDTAMLFDLRQNRATNLLFVGRIVPNKRFDKLVDILADAKKLCAKPPILHLVGKVWDEAYLLRIMMHAVNRGVLSDIRFYYDAPTTTVRTLFAAADAFVSMSEHEGFMVPILEAFSSGCPVVACPNAAIGETMGDAGIKVVPGRPEIAAGIVEMLRIDRNARRDIIEGQASRVLEFHPMNTFAKWLDLLGRFAAIEKELP